MADTDNKSSQSETAELRENGEIAITVFAESAAGRRVHGGCTVAPEDANYLQCKVRFGLVKAGDCKTIDSEWRDGHWVEIGA
jgi:hypothetical protein